MLSKQEFSTMVEEKSVMLYRVARSMLRNDEDCKDVLQEAILKAWAARHKLREERYFSTWLTRILINECKQLMRKRRGILVPLESVGGLRGDADVPDISVQDAVDRLPEPLRVAVVLHYTEGFSIEEIASILRVPATTVKGRLYQARKALRMDLGGETEEEVSRCYEA